MKTTQMPTQRQQGAFTLIELLTVIAIIGILASILIPVVSSVRDSAARANCASNLRQIGTALHLYADDHEGRLPGPYFAPITHSTQETTDTRVFTNDMASYLQPGLNLSGDPQVVEIVVSPAFTRRFSSDDDIRNGMSYRLNTADEIFGNNSSSNEPRPMRLQEITDPTLMWAVIDVDATIYPGRSYSLAREPLHGDVRNVLYVDGHVGSVSSDIRPVRGEYLR